MSIYTSTARFDGARPLSDDEIRKIAPSIFMNVAHESRSERFVPIPTIDILHALADEGFATIGVQQQKTRYPGYENYGQHLIRLRRIADDFKYSVGDNVMEVILRNANDGSSSYRLMAGLWRIRCLNSLVVHSGTIDEVVVRHTGDAIKNVIDGSYTVIKSADRALAAPQEWSKVEIKEERRQKFAEDAFKLRFGDEGAFIKPAQLLEHRRDGDQGTDAWTVFNVVQENCIKGGIGGVTAKNHKHTTRPIAAIRQTVEFNRELWSLGEEMVATA